MQMKNRLFIGAMALAMTFGIGCSQQRANNPSNKDNVTSALKDAGYDKVNVDEDRDKGVITLKGDVNSDAEKAKAEEVAKGAAGTEIIANELLVAGNDEGQAKDVAGKTDDAIEASWKEYVAANNLDDQHIRANAKNGVLTLSGDVDTPAQRASVEKDAAKIDGVTQVINKLTVKNAKGGHKHATQNPGQ
jgi:hyperosmotically inducible protein